MSAWLAANGATAVIGAMVLAAVAAAARHVYRSAKGGGCAGCGCGCHLNDDRQK